jgi:hypothetical protein
MELQTITASAAGALRRFAGQLGAEFVLARF